ncbi:MAG: hexulose-6-phosphate isomerase [bacterium]|nr:MAG: hexulose-6-phosphate isomerase [bacterium]
MKGKHGKTLKAVFEKPVKANIKWKDIEAMLIALDAYIEEARGSRLYIELNDISAVFHRPHPRKETDKGAVAAMKRFLEEAGIKP